jgi:DNA (cytosine-5)-methyltransferase 1
MNKIKTFSSSFQKFEWNLQEPNPLDEDRHLSKYVIQVRPSGVRVKRPNTAPSLVAMNTTQIPIIMWEGRYMTPLECKRLQSMDNLRYLPDKLSEAYAALGNAVNVHVAQLVAEALVGYATPRESVEPAQAGRERLSPVIENMLPSA